MNSRRPVNSDVGCLLLDMVGRQITVEYFDQNESFKTLLPRAGRIVQELSLTDWGPGWKLIDLDEPFDYQHKVAEPHVVKALHITQLLVKSRWEGFTVGGAEPTSVFVFLVPDPDVFDEPRAFFKRLHSCMLGHGSLKRHPTNRWTGARMASFST